MLVLQDGTPIYNIGAGTCLGILRKAKNTQIIMDLCTKVDPSTITWNLVRSTLPIKKNKIR